ncbi:MAG: glycosyl hydrolase [Arcobacteraceae bacterium]
MKKEHFVWDDYSDQPHVIKDRNFKKTMRKKYFFDYIKMMGINLFIYPLSILAAPFFRSKSVDTSLFFGMSVNLNKGLEQVELIHELGCKNILIRVPLSDIANLESYVEFAKYFHGCEITINILQDRAHIEHKMMLQESLTNIFIAFKGISRNFQIGNAINRLKWGFASVQEYLEFYEVAYYIKRNSFKEYNLLGPSVIDFEYYYTIAALFTKSKIYFDKVSALLYVDRRGAPENKQGVYDTSGKINLLYSIATLSKHSSEKIVITEANWPISNTKPYAPTSETECVSAQEYALFMLRYYLLALGTKKVETIFWHQLIAPGYGLIDNRDGIRKREAFSVYQTMIEFLQEAQIIRLTHSKNIYKLSCKKNERKFDVLWTNQEETIALMYFHEVYNMQGVRLLSDITISKKPIYVYYK